MKITIDENNYIIGFATVGSIENSISVDFNVSDFKELPCFLFKYENGKLKLDNLKKEQYNNFLENQNQIEKLKNEVDKINVWISNYDLEYLEYERCKRLGIEYSKDIQSLNTELKSKLETKNSLNSELEVLEKAVENTGF